MAPTVSWPVWLFGVLLAPVVEEPIFRGALWDLVHHRIKTAPSAVTILITSLIFGLAHLPWSTPAHAAGVGLVGIGLGILRARTGGLCAPVIGHGVCNLFYLVLQMQA